jgi:hypothetical protein
MIENRQLQIAMIDKELAILKNEKKLGHGSDE